VERLSADAPPSLAVLTAASLQKDPAARPADGTALLAILGLAPTTIDVVPETEQTRVIARPGKPARRSARLTTGAVLGLVFLAAAGGLVAWAVARPPSTAPGVASTRGSAEGTQKNRQAGSTGISLAATGATRTHQTRARTGTTRATTTGRTTTAATTTPAGTTTPTTAPGTTTTIQSTTTPSTTTGSTTSPTTTAATTSTTVPATTASTTAG
jgi:hypothetical protein